MSQTNSPKKPTGRRCPSCGARLDDGGQPAGESRELTYDDLRRMSPDEINSRWSEVAKVLREHRG